MARVDTSIIHMKTFSLESSEGRDEVKLVTRPKYNDVKWSYLSVVYASIIIGFALSLSMLNYSQQNSEFDNFLKLIMTVAYLMSIISLFALMIFLFYNRLKTFEKTVKTELPSEEPSIIYSEFGESIGIYMKLGLLVFGCCSILYGLNISNIFYKFEGCQSTVSIVMHITQIVFFLVQMIFVIRYNTLVMILHNTITKVILAQALLTSVVTWIQISISKSYNFYKAKSLNNCSFEKKNYLTSHLLAFLTPMVAEFLIMTIVVLYEIYFRVGHISLINIIKKRKEPILKSIIRCEYGVILSTLIVLIVIEILLFIILYKDSVDKMVIMKLQLVEEILLNLSGITTNCVLLHITKTFKFTYPYFINNVDSHLLDISTVFSILYCIQTVIGGQHVVQLVENQFLHYSPDDQMFLSFRSATSIVEGMNVILQTFVIKDGFHRCAEHKNLKFKPGQNSIIILIGINVSLWIIKSFQLNNTDILYIKDEFIKEMASDKNQLSSFFLFFTKPLIMLYRYHSSVCLSNILNRMYEDESHRFELMLRIEGLREEKEKTNARKIIGRQPHHKISSDLTDMRHSIFKRTTSMLHLNKAKKRINITKTILNKI